MKEWNTKKRFFPVGEIYHVYNRGTDGRNITQDMYDSERFVQSLELFNTVDPIGSIYQHSFTGPKSKLHKPQLSSPTTKLVHILAYCINPNHYHLLIQVVTEKGLSTFMHRFGTGFTRFFNEKYGRSGSLFQGRFKARHITSDSDLMKMSAYVNLNNKVHQLSSPTTKLVRNSMGQYAVGERGLADTSFIMHSFSSGKQYKKFAEDTICSIKKLRKDLGYEKYQEEVYGNYLE